MFLFLSWINSWCVWTFLKATWGLVLRDTEFRAVGYLQHYQVNPVKSKVDKKDLNPATRRWHFISLCLSLVGRSERYDLFGSTLFGKKSTAAGCERGHVSHSHFSHCWRFLLSWEHKTIFFPLQSDACSIAPASHFPSALDPVAEFTLAFFSKTWACVPALQWAETGSLQSQNSRALGLYVPLAVWSPGNIVSTQTNQHFSQCNGDSKMLDNES